MSDYHDQDAFTTLGHHITRWRRARAHRRAQREEAARQRQAWVNQAIAARIQGAADMPRCPHCHVYVTFIYDEHNIVHNRTERVPCAQHADPVSAELERQVAQ